MKSADSQQHASTESAEKLLDQPFTINTENGFTKFLCSTATCSELMLWVEVAARSGCMPATDNFSTPPILGSVHILGYAETNELVAATAPMHHHQLAKLRVTVLRAGANHR